MFKFEQITGCPRRLQITEHLEESHENRGRTNKCTERPRSVGMERPTDPMFQNFHQSTGRPASTGQLAQRERNEWDTMTVG